MQKIENVIDLLNDFKSASDGTYSISTQESVEYPDGYQVSFVRPEAFEQLNRKGWDIITNQLCIYLDSPVHIGVYGGDKEVSFHCMCKNKAVETMIKYNQESILDWEKKNQRPNSIPDWFIVNNAFDEKMVVNYEELIDQIQ